MLARWLLPGFCLTLLLSGCASPNGWDRRVGRLTYPEAMAELGKPATLVVHADGSREASWMIEPGTAKTIPPGVGGTLSLGEIPSGSRSLTGDLGTYPDQYLHLTFSSNGVLRSWSSDQQPIRSP